MSAPLEADMASMLKRAHVPVDVLEVGQLIAVLKWLAEDYWNRRVGWPDLLSWVEGPEGEIQARLFADVKSRNDRWSLDQRALWSPTKNDPIYK